MNQLHNQFNYTPFEERQGVSYLHEKASDALIIQVLDAPASYTLQYCENICLWFVDSEKTHVAFIVMLEVSQGNNLAGMPEEELAVAILRHLHLPHQYLRVVRNP